MKTALQLIIAVLLMAFLPASLESPAFPQPSPPAYSWLEGAWEGDGFGGRSEEVWSAPSPHGTMMGTYRHHDADGNLTFYEFLVLDSLGMHVKHFQPDLTAWEEKTEYHTFEMVRASARELELKGLRIEYLPPDSMRLYLNMRQDDGTLHTEIFRMKRKQP